MCFKTIKYIRSQEEHHKKQSVRAEYKAFLDAYQIEYDDQYVFEDYKLNGCWTEGEIDKLPSQHNGRYPTPIEFAK